MTSVHCSFKASHRSLSEEILYPGGQQEPGFPERPAALTPAGTEAVGGHLRVSGTLLFAFHLAGLEDYFIGSFPGHLNEIFISFFPDLVIQGIE